MKRKFTWVCFMFKSLSHLANSSCPDLFLKNRKMQPLHANVTVSQLHSWFCFLYSIYFTSVVVLVLFWLSITALFSFHSFLRFVSRTRFSNCTVFLIYLPTKTLTSIIRTSWPILKKNIFFIKKLHSWLTWWNLLWFLSPIILDIQFS